MTVAFFSTRRARAIDEVIALERRRIEWMSRYIEWSVEGYDGEARIAREYVREIRRKLAATLRMSRVWSWLAGEKGSVR